VDLCVLSGTSHPALADAVRRTLGAGADLGRVERFPDGEIHVEVDERVGGADVFIVQATGVPGGEHLLELLLLSDACRRMGAARVSAVLPYFGYARQDRRARVGEAVGARVVADLLDTGHFARVVALDLHTDALEGFLSAPLDQITAFPLLVEAVRPYAGPDSVVVAPDAGAGKRARRFAEALGVHTALIHKTRVSGREVSAHDVVGEVRGMRPILVDDMISTGGTIAAAGRCLLEQGCAEDLTVVVSHALLVEAAVQRLSSLPIRLIATDSLPPPAALPFAREVVPLAPLLAEAVRRLHLGRPLGDLGAAR
jgi:ribose-phosphate pyrophosphokinase